MAGMLTSRDADPSDIAYVEQRWLDLLPAAERNSAQGRSALRELLDAYGGPKRRYHGLRHIVALLRLSDAQAGQFADRATVDLAIFYHDVVYDSARKDNEAQSARLAEQRLAPLGFAPNRVRRVAALIEATAHGMVAPDRGDRDLLRFLDLDLSVLGQTRAIYARYAADIRAEYAAVPAPLYRQGRGQVLQSFLDRPRIYSSADLHTRWDQSARENMLWELTQLDRLAP